MSLSVRIVAVLAGLALAAIGVPGWFLAPSVAAGSAGDGSNWGPSGLTGSPSVQTVTWDNAGNAASNTVPRDGRQQLPHTAGKTYDDISGSVVSKYFDAYGPGNGFGGLKMSVSQTRDLVNQSVTLDISGVKGGAPYGLQSNVYLQVFQCWGGLTASGSPDPGAADPDPATCQMGSGDAAAHSGGFAIANSRYINTDPLVPGGDWGKYFNKGGSLDVPFTALTGQKSGSTNAGDNQFFNSATTNEVSHIQMSAGGTATRQFEVQTSLESAGLGCGLRRGVVSTRSCWLVVVPRVGGVLDQNGPIAPSLWAQRMQVKLGFRDIVAGCPSGQDRTLTAGSELLSSAAASWTPGLCGAKNIALGYTQIGDPVARAQFGNGASDAVLTTEPADKPATYVPVALAAPVIAYSLSYQPFCAARAAPYTEAEAVHQCKYPSLAALTADQARSGTLIRNLKLDARLVAKLLTQSYVFSIFDQTGFHRQGWMVEPSRASSLANDPEFLRLNPDLAHISVTSSSINNLDHFVLEALRSDSASAVWNWLLADHDARSFIDGCPDANGMVINPFYSSRTYAECQGQMGSLSKKANLNRDVTNTPDSYVDLAPTYPPDGSPYPLPDWQESAVAGNPPYSVYDFLPRADSMPTAGRDVAIGYLPRNSNLCLTEIDPSCVPAPGKWTDPKDRQPGDRLGAMAITTSATAARFQLPTAELCDTSGNHCVGASTATLHKAASEFVKTSTAGVLAPGPTDYAGGAYPLTMPVYAGVAKSLSSQERGAYASALAYLTTTGQRPGYSVGNLPPGYAPLTSKLKADADAGIAELRQASVTSPSPTPTSGSSLGSGPNSIPNPPPPGANTPPGAVPTGGQSPSGQGIASDELVSVASQIKGWPKWPLPLGLAITVIAGLAGPAMRLRGTVKVGWPE